MSSRLALLAGACARSNAELLERVQLLVKENLHPTVNVWDELLKKKKEGKKLSMQQFFKVVNRMTATFNCELLRK